MDNNEIKDQAVEIEEVKSESEVLAHIKKSTDEIIQISKSVFKGKTYLDIRVFFENKEGEFRPTKKGLRLSPELFSGLLEIMQVAHAEIQ